MMKTGTRVIALTSTLKKGMGPRKGSIGYITNRVTSQPQFDRQFKTFVSGVHVIFTRYGFESKQRREHRYFINMLPILTGGSLSDLGHFEDPIAIKEYFDSKLDELAQIDIKDYGIWREIEKELVYTYGSGKVYTGVLVPISRPDLLTCDNLDFIAWLDAMLANQYIYKDLKRLIGSKNKKLFNIIDGSTISDLNEMISNKKFKVGMLIHYASTSERRKEVIRNLAAAHSITHRYNERKREEGLISYLRSRSGADFLQGSRLISSLTLLYSPSYCESEFLWKAKLLFENMKDRNPVDIFLRAMTELRCLGQDLEERGESLVEAIGKKKEAACSKAK